MKKFYLYVNGQFHSTFYKKDFASVLRYARGKSFLYGFEYMVAVKNERGAVLCEFWGGYRHI